MKTRTLSILFLLLSVAAHASPALPVNLKSIAPHPRLFANEAKWESLRNQVKTDPVSAQLYELVLARADGLLAQPTVTYKKEGRRLLGPARNTGGRILHLATAARLSGDRRYSDRAILELRAAAALTDWNPSHFLDTGEMTFAMAVGYDWLFDFLSPADRASIETAIIHKGLLPSCEPHLGWTSGSNNWTQVCHGGLTAGALATAELNPELAQNIIQRAITNLPGAAHAYFPDGAYPEGPGYWGYGTSYHVILAACLKSALGSTFGLETFPGFLASADYIREVTAPSGDFFNYADCGSNRTLQPVMFWFAQQRRDGRIPASDIKALAPLLSNKKADTEMRSEIRFLPLALLWRDPTLSDAGPQLPLSWFGGGENPIAVHRSAWDDPLAVFVGIKGGRAGSPHAHMDSGSFILESGGVRWAVDPGLQNYNSLESQGVKLWDLSQDSPRWNVFRPGSDAHNILRFNKAPQRVDQKALIVDFHPDGDAPHTTIDLTPVYRDQASSVRRTVTLQKDRTVLIHDEWTAGAAPVEVAWQWLTLATVTVGTSGVHLAQSGKTLSLKIITPAKARIGVEDMSHPQHPYDAPNPGLQRITFTTTTPAGERAEWTIRAGTEEGSQRHPNPSTP